MVAPKLTVSIPTFNEIAGLLEQHGVKITDGRSVTLEKGTALVPPIDYRMATIRKDCIAIGANLYKETVAVPTAEEFLTFADKLLKYVLFGKSEPEENAVRNPIVKPPAGGW